jgi:trans-aconitate 2-methyltransferase
LIGRIPDIDPRRIVDLGCGTGELTAVLASRWPDAEVVGIDSSTDMIERAVAAHPAIDWRVKDIAGWEPKGSLDLIFSNATLHWLDDHATLFPLLRSFLTRRGALAIQMPDNWREPTHRVPAEILDSGDWPDAARRALMRDRVSPVDDYRSWLAPAELDMWRTTYYQTLIGPHPVWDWVTGSVLRPVLAALDEDDESRFEADCKRRYAEAYPSSRGRTTLPFSRLFLLAVAG